MSIQVKQLYFNFLGATVSLGIHPEVEGELAFVLRFFRANIGDVALHEVNFSVEFVAWASAAPELLTCSGRRVAMRRSSAPEFDLHVERCERGDRTIFRCAHTWIDAPERCHCHGDDFRIGVSEGSTVMVIDFMRDLVIRHLESRGRVVLHAAGSLVDGELVAICGAKGAGKTTSLLHSLESPRCRYFTGDKIFLEQRSDGIWGHPWRDWPYIGFGTLSHARWLLSRLKPLLGEVASKPERAKVLIDPDEFESKVGGADMQPRRLSVLLFPRVAPGEPCQTHEVTDGATKWALVNQSLERLAATSFFSWQSYLVPDYTKMFETLATMRPALEALSVYEGTGDLRRAVIDAADAAFSRAACS